jgi:5-methylcytosine-specific restriction endonuclease McrA
MPSPRYKDSRKLPMTAVFPKIPGKCAYCQKPLTGRQTSWCSKDCGEQAFNDVMFARGSSTHIRAAVFARDNGICASCGVDCKKLQRISNYVYYRSLPEYCKDTFKRTGWNPSIICFRDKWGGDFSSSLFEKEYFKAARKLWANTPLNFGFSCWQADHILEVTNGGAHSMENLQTLCNSCHKTKTKNLHAGRRKQPSLF